MCIGPNGGLDTSGTPLTETQDCPQVRSHLGGDWRIACQLNLDSWTSTLSGVSPCSRGPRDTAAVGPSWLRHNSVSRLVSLCWCRTRMAINHCTEMGQKWGCGGEQGTQPVWGQNWWICIPDTQKQFLWTGRHGGDSSSNLRNQRKRDILLCLHFWSLWGQMSQETSRQTDKSVAVWTDQGWRNSDRMERIFIYWLFKCSTILNGTSQNMFSCITLIFTVC